MKKLIILSVLLAISLSIYSQPMIFSGYTKSSATVENRNYVWGEWEDVDDFTLSIDLDNHLIKIFDEEFYIFSLDSDEEDIADEFGNKCDIATYTIVDDLDLLAKIVVKMYKEEPTIQVVLQYGDRAYAYQGYFYASENKEPN